MVTTCLLLSKASGQLQMIKKITFQFHSLSCQLSSSKLFAKARNERLCLLCRSYFCSYVCVFVCVCVVSQFDLSITKQNYLFVRCESLSHIPNTSLRCSNQPLWKLSLMTGINTTKQQTGNQKHNKKSNLVELNKVCKQPQRCPGKKDVLINNCSESCQGKFSVKILEKYL